MWDGGFGMGFGGIFMLLFWALIIVGIVVLVRGSISPGQPHGGAHPPPPPRRTALDILNERYARGEIDKAEFEEKRRTLGD